MGDSLWVLVYRYDATLAFLRGHVAQLREQIVLRSAVGLVTGAEREQYRAWLLVLTDVERMRDEAASGAEKCEGPRAAG